MRRYFSLFILIIMSLLVGCVENEVSAQSWRALYEGEISNFVKRERIVPLAIENIDKITIMIFEKKNQRGIFHVSINSAGKFQAWEKSFFGEEGFSRPVLFSHHVHLKPEISQIAYTIIIINDSEALRTADKVKVKFSDGGVKEKRLTNNVVIIPYDNLTAGPNSYSIFDDSGGLIYKS